MSGADGVLKLQIIVGSTRPGRLGLPVADWTVEAAEKHGGFEVELVDIMDYALPVLDEPGHPRMSRYEHEHSRRWSAKIKEADAFVFVTPEYNHGPSVSLLNAVDYLHDEWLYAPVAFVSYGGVAGGLRSVQVMKQVVTSVRMMPIPEGVAIPMVMQYVQDGVFTPPPPVAGAVPPMLTELARWAEALRPLRMGPPPPSPLPGPPIIRPGSTPAPGALGADSMPANKF
ncbi:NADPH-dependent FMN reductase [Streptomyces sp. DSM 15324]|uniref:NADPH-dependent FMN reductase n=1 Tax=Streptomyces sp. DSM 15324 TaxID=1739111 RepID=UPI000746B74D|nr:NADPH-dependent FMN reductase [Streptomyces sp. DSM 15324]KUO10300.1 NADPH-dependent FMN reductase [Streptomyces sp. DSM 15324]